MGQLVLRQLIQHVALVLPPFRTPQQAVFAAFRVVGHPGVVSRGDIVVAKRQRPVQQGAEFQLPVAVDARIWRPPAAYSAVNLSITHRRKRSVSLNT